ncbi:hypothetical protein LCGC14_1925950 [marine sediment metagenome]|uniref:HNH nuclease domain-containing protein n=1 Tax=marine sediment metagenome TaxID=412755 RepID=A0A0F9FPB6_9ZZZZ
MKTNCNYCRKEIDRIPSRIKNHNVFCNNREQMLYEYDKGIRDRNQITKEANEKVRKFGQPKLKGRIHSLEYKNKMSLVCKGINKGKLNGMYGKRPYNYIDGLGRKYWKDAEWIRIKELAKRRDNHCCVKCGITEEQSLKENNLYLSVDHKIPYRKVMEHKLENTQTLCFPCHGIKTNLTQE